MCRNFEKSRKRMHVHEKTLIECQLLGYVGCPLPLDAIRNHALTLPWLPNLKYPNSWYSQIKPGEKTTSQQTTYNMWQKVQTWCLLSIYLKWLNNAVLNAPGLFLLETGSANSMKIIQLIHIVYFYTVYTEYIYIYIILYLLLLSLIIIICKLPTKFETIPQPLMNSSGASECVLPSNTLKRLCGCASPDDWSIPPRLLGESPWHGPWPEPRGMLASKQTTEKLSSKCTNVSFESSSWWLNQPIWQILLKLDHVPNFRGENKKYLKPPTSHIFIAYLVPLLQNRKTCCCSQVHKAGIVSQHSQGQLPQALNALTAQGSCRRNAGIVFAFQGPSKQAGICWLHIVDKICGLETGLNTDWWCTWTKQLWHGRLVCHARSTSLLIWSTVNQEQFRNWNPSHWEQLTKEWLRKSSSVSSTGKLPYVSAIFSHCFSRIVVAWVNILLSKVFNNSSTAESIAKNFKALDMQCATCNVLTHSFVILVLFERTSVPAFKCNKHSRLPADPVTMSNPAASKASPKSSRHLGCKRAQYRNSKAWCKPSELKPCSLRFHWQLDFLFLQFLSQRFWLFYDMSTFDAQLRSWLMILISWLESPRNWESKLTSLVVDSDHSPINMDRKKGERTKP